MTGQSTRRRIRNPGLLCGYHDDTPGTREVRNHIYVTSPEPIDPMRKRAQVRVGTSKRSVEIRSFIERSPTQSMVLWIFSALNENVCREQSFMKPTAYSACSSLDTIPTSRATRLPVSDSWKFRV
jgi:hypothetical protein